MLWTQLKWVLSLCFFDNFRPQTVHFSTIDYFLLFLHRVSSHLYLYHRQNMDPMYPSSWSGELVEEIKIKLCAFLGSQRVHFPSQWQVLKDSRDHPVIGNIEDSISAHLWMYFSSVDRSYVKLFLFSTVSPNITFLKKGFIVVRACCKWKESRWRLGVKRRDNSWHIDWYKRGSSGHLQSYDFESLWWVNIAIFVTWSKSYKRIDVTGWIKLT